MVLEGAKGGGATEATGEDESDTGTATASGTRDDERDRKRCGPE